MSFDRPVAGEAFALWGGDGPPSWRPRPGVDWRPTLTPCLSPANAGRGLVLVLPGGGYGGRAAHEHEPVARAFRDLGFQAAVLDYRTAGEVETPLDTGPLRDVLRAVRGIRRNADAWLTRPDKIAVLGFSAGGHLAASSGVHARAGADDAEKEAGRPGGDPEPGRPDALVLCYPVLTATELGHAGSVANLVGAAPETPEAAIHWASLERHVDADTPPAFLWHTADDQAVPVENSFLFAAAMRRAGRPFSLHVFPHGAHGLGLAAATPDASAWPGLAARFLESLGF